MRYGTGTKLAGSACLAAMLWAGQAQAFEFELGGVTFGVQGFIRHELAVRLSNDCNYNVQSQDCFIGSAQPNTFLRPGGDAPLFGLPTIAGATTIRGQSTQSTSYVNNTASFFPPFNNDPVGSVNTWDSDDGDFNLFAFRGNLEVDAKISQKFQGFFRFRVWSEPGVGYTQYAGYQPNESRGGQFSTQALRDEPTRFEQDIFNGKASRLEFAQNDYVVDIPAAYIDYYDGPLWIRLGQQQIAWGEMLFFRVLDVPNGLDLRRHFFFDFAAEEYADERVASPGIRVTYNVTDNWSVEAFGQMFQPSILPGENSPYDVIANGFDLIHDTGMQEGADYASDWNYGMRIKGTEGQWTFQAIAVNRRNPDGIIRWTSNRGKLNDPNSAASIIGAPPGAGVTSEQTVGYADETGTCSGYEWTTKAAFVRLDGFEGASHFGGWGGDNLFGLPALYGVTGDNDTDVRNLQNVVDAFNALSGNGCGFRGAIRRDYPWEAVFGGSVGYIVESSNQWLDQLLIRLEGTYTPNKKFTALGAGQQDEIRESEILLALNMEKYQRLFEAFPSTYFVFQYLWKSESDLYGRHLSGNGGDSFNLAGYDGGDDNSHYLVFAFQQPFPNLVWRFDFNFLMDVKGGYFFQPGVRYKPGGNYAVEAFVNLFASDGGNDDIIETVEHLDEFGLRLTYQF